MASPRRPTVGSVTHNPVYAATPSPRRPSNLRPSSTVLPKGVGPSSTPIRTPLTCALSHSCIPHSSHRSLSEFNSSCGGGLTVDATLQQQNWARWCGPDPAKDAQQLVVVVVELEQFLLLCEHAHPEHHRRYGVRCLGITCGHASCRLAAAGGVTLTASTRATVAKQLTKIEYDLFRAVPSSEFMDICKSNVPRPSLSRLVEHTNKASTSLLLLLLLPPQW